MAPKNNRPGSFVISLDFELYWGVRDKVDLDAYRASLLGARAVIPRLLDRFAGKGIHATWATVGFLFFDEKDELLAHLPARRSGYADPNLSPYEHVLRIGLNEHKDPCHYARSLLRQIQQCPARRSGATPSRIAIASRRDRRSTSSGPTEAAQAAARGLGIALRSLVFPRNQWREENLAACAQAGLRVVRGSERAWMYRPDAGGARNLAKRAGRLADSYVSLSGHHGQQVVSCAGHLVDVPSSRFLRPFSPRLAALDPLRMRRIRASMDHAAEHGLIYHLWWHPHNFGRHPDESLRFLSHVLNHFERLSMERGMVSRTMGELIPQDASA